jgi:hypothetical protein
MLAMYISYKIIGLAGMILGPIIMSLCKVVIELASSPAIIASPIPAPALTPDTALKQKHIILKTKSKKRG